MKRNDVLDMRGRRRVQTSFEGEESLTNKGALAQSEIRSILQRQRAIGVVDHLNEVQAAFRDVTRFTDLHDAMLQAKQAEAYFMQLSPQLRGVFDNDATKWLDAAHDEDKRVALRPRLEALGYRWEGDAPVINAGADGRSGVDVPPPPSPESEGP